MRKIQLRATFCKSRVSPDRGRHAHSPPGETMTGMNWTRSTHCTTGTCVEVAFARSTFCGSNACVEVGFDGDLVLVRDSKQPGTELVFFPDEWVAFVAGVKAGEFDNRS